MINVIEKNKFIAWFVILAVLFLLVFFPFVAFADKEGAGGLVPCGGANPCTLCDLYHLLQHIVYFLMWNLAPVLAILVVAWGGFNILIAGGDASRKQVGIKAMKAAIIGLLIVFSAWVIINEFILFFAGGGSGTGTIFSNPWTDVQCIKK